MLNMQISLHSKITLASLPQLICRGPPFIVKQTSCTTCHRQVLAAIKTHRSVLSKPAGLTTVLGSHYQPYVGRGASIHARSPRALVPPIKAILHLAQSLSTLDTRRSPVRYSGSTQVLILVSFMHICNMPEGG
jgi:hypothetical protein